MLVVRYVSCQNSTDLDQYELQSSGNSSQMHLILIHCQLEGVVNSKQFKNPCVCKEVPSKIIAESFFSSQVACLITICYTAVLLHIWSKPSKAVEISTWRVVNILIGYKSCGVFTFQLWQHGKSLPLLPLASASQKGSPGFQTAPAVPQPLRHSAGCRDEHPVVTFRCMAG